MRTLLAFLIASLAMADEARPTLIVTSERPWYRPGEEVCLRAILLDALTRAPVATASLVCFQVRDGRDHVVWSGMARVEDSVAATTWKPADAGGSFLVSAAIGDRVAAEPRRVLIARTVEGLEGRVAAELTFDRRGYVPGETAEVRVALRGRDGTPLANRPAILRVALGGGAAREVRVVSDAEGRASIQVPIPADLAQRDGTVTASIPDAGTAVVASRSLPLASAHLDLQATIDGGVLVGGLPAMVYLQSRSQDGQPADCRGTLRDGAGNALAAFATRHEGRCCVAFTPAVGMDYHLVVEQPARQEFTLPAVQATGAVILGSAVQAADGPVHLRIQSTVTGTWRLRLVRRNTVVADHPCALTAGIVTPVEVPLTAGVAGVIDAVLTTPDGTASIQRTLFLRPARRITLTVTAPPTIPLGAPADVELRLADAAGAPLAGVCSLSVVDAGDEDLIEARERPARLPALAWLNGEVEELADADSYLQDGAGAAERLDLLLGVQGWRRGSPAASPRLRRLGVLPVPALPFQLAPALSTPAGALDTFAEVGQGGAFMAIGAGGSSGSFGYRTGGGRRRAVIRNGGTRASETAVVADSRFLQRHQSADGHWSAAAWPLQSTLDDKADGIGTWTDASADRSCTALATLAYLGAGYDHRTPSRYKAMVLGAVTWLVGQIGADGRCDPDPEVQAGVVTALAEAYGMTADPTLRQPTQMAIDALLKQQHAIGGWAASGRAEDDHLDAVASTWCVMALKSALASGLNVRDSLNRAKSYFTTAWQAANPDWQRLDPMVGRSTFPAVYDAATHQAHAPDRAAAGAWMAVMLGHHAGSQQLDTLTNRVLDQPPLAPPFDPLHVYWGTLACFQRGGAKWLTWNATMRDVLVNLQRTDLPDAGSWDPSIYGATGTRWGRLLSTAITTLDLEIYYRYTQVEGSGAASSALADRRTVMAPGLSDEGLPNHATVAWWAAEPSGAAGRLVLTLPALPRGRRLTLRADAFDARGGFTAAATTLEVRQPVELAVRLPSRLTVGDRWDAPVNLRGADASEVAVEGEAIRAIVHDGRLEIVAVATGSARVRLHAASSLGTDTLAGGIVVEAPGAPWHDGGQRHGSARLELPPAQGFLPGTLHGSLVVESGFEDLLDAVHRHFLHEPHGCFEQTSSSSYPLLVSCERRRRRQQDDGGAATFLTQAVALLQGFACPSGGFSLFGRDPGDPVLTAFGLRQLKRLGAVVAVNRPLLDRQQAWLLAQRRTDGGFHSGVLNTAPGMSDVQIAADLGSDCPPADRGRAYAAARLAGDAYALGLAARLAREAGDADQAAALASMIRLDQDGAAIRPGASPWRPVADVEATALAVLAYFADGRVDDARRGLAWLGAQRHGEAWNTTQSDVLAIEAFAAAEDHETRPAPSTVIIRRDGQELARLAIPVHMQEMLQRPLAIDPVGGPLEVVIAGPAPAWRWRLDGRLAQPTDAANAPMSLTITAPAHVAVGAPCTVLAHVQAHAEVYAPMLIVGLPAGLEPRAEALDRLVRAGQLGCWEWADGEVRLYGERLAVGATWDIPITCVAIAAGTSQGRPSSAYPYYQPELTVWQPGQRIAVDP